MADLDLFGQPTDPETPLTAWPRLWVPEILFDEVTPEPRPMPEDWLFKDANGKYWVGADPTDPTWAIDVAAYETVLFCFVRRWGTATFTIHPDGSFTTSIPLPASANTFCDVSDWETVMDTPEKFAAAWAEMIFAGDENTEPLDVEVYVHEWSDDRPFRLVVDEAGGARLEEVTTCPVA